MPQQLNAEHFTAPEMVEHLNTFLRLASSRELTAEANAARMLADLAIFFSSDLPAEAFGGFLTFACIARDKPDYARHLLIEERAGT